MNIKRKIFNIFAAIVMVFGSTPLTFLSAYADEEPTGIVPAEENIPQSLKSVISNEDGTYDITLEIKGVSSQQENATKANVVVIFDSSGSMNTSATTYTYSDNTSGNYGKENGTYVQLYRKRYGSCERMNSTNSTTQVYSSYSNCNNNVLYTGTRYTRMAQEGTRMSVAKSAVNVLANELLSQNDPSSSEYKDVVEMAFIDFATSVKSNLGPTTNLGTFQGWVNSVSAGGGTNWEAALSAARDVDFGEGDEDKTYIIFVSDGNPTFRDSRYDPGATDNCYRESYFSPWICDEVWGTGSDDDNGWNLGAAQAVATTLINTENTEFFTIGAFGDATNMRSLGGTYYSADNQDALEQAFADIVDKITTGLSVADLQIEDGITAATSTEVDGTAGNFRYSVPTSWGSDWAKATFEGGSVHWNPGEHKTLSNNETASVTFTVWPSQEAMDCIASLRNDGACSIADLTKFGLGENEDGSFRLITNSSATFRFRTATKVEGSDEQEYSEISVPITFREHRDPTNLPETELEVTKLWEDGMNPEQRDDIKEVTLKLKVDNDEVRTFVFNKQGASTSEWVNNYTYAVAPGVMKKLTTETEELRSLGEVVKVGSDEYVILEEGHDYLFDESYVLDEDGSNHYYISKKLYHPMIVGEGGNIHDVVFTDNGDSTRTAEIDDTLLTKLSAENTLNGGILVGKKVINNSQEDKEITDTYPITITINGADTGIYRVYTYNTDGSLKGRTDPITYTGGKIERAISVNQKIRVQDLPTGATFEVTEDLPEGYEPYDVNYQLVRFDENGGEHPSSSAEDIKKVFGNASAQAEVVNKLESGDLTIKKTVDVQSGDKTQAENQLFGFTVYFYKNESDTNPVRIDDSTCNKKGDVDNRIKHSETCTIENIPKGWYYKVVEGAMSGFNGGNETTVTGTIKKGDNEASFVNKYAVTPVDTKIVAYKAFVDGYQQFWINSDSFEFQLIGDNEIIDSGNVTFSNNYVEFKREYENPGTYNYTITEKTKNDDGSSAFRHGVMRQIGDADINVTVKVVDNGEGALEIESIEYSKKDQTIYNLYKDTKTYGVEGELDFTKVLEGREWRNSDEFTFKITGSDGAPMPEDTELTVKSSTKDHTVSFGTIEFTEEDVDNEYVYTVTEEFDVPSVEADESVANGIMFTVSVDFNEKTGSLDLIVSDHDNVFTNIYRTTDVTASKAWDDDNDRDGLRENYEGYYVAVKNDEGKYVAYEELALEDKDDYVFSGLPKLNADGEEINYTIVEASTCSGEGDSIECTEFNYDDYYTVNITEDGKITNSHEPELYNRTGELTVKKIWADESSKLDRPGSVLVDLLANGEVIDTAEIIAGQDNEWTYTFDGLYTNEDGEPIEYSVQESAIGEMMFGEDESEIIVYTDEGAIAGSWTKSIDNEKYEVTNTWKEAEPDEIIYEGEDEFTIIKVDEDNKPLSGVTFEISDYGDETTKEGGEITIKVPISDNERDESFEYVISEKAAKEGYDPVEGSATVTVSCVSELFDKDVKTLTNTYIKTCTFEKTGGEKYVWDESEEGLTLTVVNKRSMAKSFIIRKNVVGAPVEMLQNLTFMITGPEDFGDNGEMTLVAGEDCTFSEDVIVCNVNEKIPTGNYMVEEGNAEIDGYNLLRVSGDGDSMDVKSGARAVFEITNEYEFIEPEDPCADGEGCGGVEPELVIETPETGKLTKEHGIGATDSVWISNIIIGTVLLVIGGAGILVGRRVRK